ncbi:hypothetical protein PanWU01x14_269630 [Parasponia andersonii]|uniref:Transmembrane protein n=1 Tax=Parasponia andersonii TaxID=3476 RepID=A0A2P5B5F6_PARAD|nr:hypothetical protein PanWU01x14_269630 [Parasponia andersonii]
MRLALKRASSSQPAMAATDLNLGLKILFVQFGLLSVLFGSLGLSFWSSLPIFGLDSPFLMVEGEKKRRASGFFWANQVQSKETDWERCGTRS